MLMRALFYTLRMRSRVQRASGIPCALFTFEGVKFPANLGRNVSRDREAISRRRPGLEPGPIITGVDVSANGSNGITKMR